MALSSILASLQIRITAPPTSPVLQFRFPKERLLVRIDLSVRAVHRGEMRVDVQVREQAPPCALPQDGRLNRIPSGWGPRRAPSGAPDSTHCHRTRLPPPRPKPRLGNCRSRHPHRRRPIMSSPRHAPSRNADYLLLADGLNPATMHHTK